MDVLGWIDVECAAPRASTLGACDRTAPMSWAQIGLVFVIALPVAVIVAMLFWPSRYDDPPTVDDPDPTVPLPRRSGRRRR